MDDAKREGVPLAMVRRSRGWSQRALAVASDVPSASIAAAEARGYRLPPEARVRIAEALGLSPSQARLVMELAP